MATPRDTRSKAIRYAEDDLGVHLIYTEAVNAEQEIREHVLQKADYEVAIRHHEQELDERIYELRQQLHEETGDKPLSATAFESTVKDMIGSDEKVKALKAKIIDEKDLLSYVEANLRDKELTHRSRVSRMTEIGGYLHYLAAAKNANTAARESASSFPW